MIGFRSSLLCAALALGACLAAAAAEAEAPIELRFAEFFARPIGSHGLAFTPRLEAAAGRNVRIVGYVVPREQATPGRFLLTPRPVRLSEHADGEADDLPPSTVSVLLDASQRNHVVVAGAEPVSLTGRLELGRLDDGAGRVSWLRLQLPPHAVADQPLASNPTAP